jgi:ATP-dependent RNA helicase DeaD
MEKFTQLGLSKGLTDVLKQYGFKEPSEIQKKTIPLALAGRDIIGGSSTGSGKTLAFASAIIENLKPSREIKALILTPTRELAEQVATSIRNFSRNKKLNVLAVYGGVNIDTQMKRIPSTDILVGTPGRILDHLNRRSLRFNHVEFLVLDEVDRMFDMGFRKDVEKIIHECPEKRQTMLFSATISPDIDYLSKKYTKNPLEVSVDSYVDPSKLKQVYYDVPDYQKFSLLVSLLKKENADLVMVFCNTRRNVDFVADNLIKAGISAKAIHGGIEQNKRIRVLDEFHKRGLGVLVCTDVAARGLDIKGVSHVYNYEVPSEPKDYIHRIGRTARAGKEGKAVIILASRDYDNFRYLMRSQNIEIESLELPHIETVNIKINTPRGNNRFIRGPKRDVSRGRGFDKNPERESRRENPRRSFGVRRSESGRRSGGRTFGRSNSFRGRSDSGRSDNNSRGSSRSFSSRKRF